LDELKIKIIYVTTEEHKTLKDKNICVMQWQWVTHRRVGNVES